MSKVRVGVAGYGVIGNRLAAGVAAQDDLELVGVADVAPTLAVRALRERGMPFPLFAAVPGSERSLADAGIPVSGSFDDLLADVDVMLDSAPGGIGAENKVKYLEHGVKAVFQGGEAADIADLFFHGTVNYEQGLGVDYLKLTSCNTTGLIRAVHAIHEAVGVTKTFITIVRRVADPGDTHRGLTNVLQVDPIPNHQAVDLMHIIPEIDATGMLIHAPVDTRPRHHDLGDATTEDHRPNGDRGIPGIPTDQSRPHRRRVQLEFLALPVGAVHGVSACRHVRDRLVGRNGRPVR